MRKCTYSSTGQTEFTYDNQNQAEDGQWQLHGPEGAKVDGVVVEIGILEEARTAAKKKEAIEKATTAQ